MHTEGYQPESMRNEIPSPFYSQHEIHRNQLINFTQIPNTLESLQMTMNSYLMGGWIIPHIKQTTMNFTGIDHEYSAEDYLTAVTANLILNIGPEPNNTPLHQNWIHRRKALIQTTLDGAAQKTVLSTTYLQFITHFITNSPLFPTGLCFCQTERGHLLFLNFMTSQNIDLKLTFNSIDLTLHFG